MPLPTRSLPWSVAPLAAFLLLATNPLAAAAKVWTQSYEIAGRPLVHVVCGDMNVRVHTRPGGPVEFRVEYDPRHRGIQIPANRDAQVEFSQSGNSVTLRVREPDNVLVIGISTVRSVIDITLPVASDLGIRTGDGDITCEPLLGRVELETEDGDVRVQGVEGTLVVRSKDGDLRAENLQGGLDVRATDGKVDASGRFAHLMIATRDGNVRVAAAAGSQPAEGWEIETGDGALRLEIPGDLRAMLDAGTHDGSIQVDLPITPHGRIRGNDFTGALNGGGPPIRLRTRDGRLTLALAE